MVHHDPGPAGTEHVSGARGDLTERDRRSVQELLRPYDWEQQLSIPYVLDGFSYEAFVLGRGGDDFDDDDLDLARHLQTLIRGLYLRSRPATTHPRCRVAVPRPSGSA